MDELLCEDEIVEVEIDTKKIYDFPQEFIVKEYKDIYLVIYTEGVLWLVLNNQEELNIFNMLNSGKSIEDVISTYDEDSVIRVISQVEGKHFEKPIIKRNENNNIYIYLTNNCNERCRHCYMFAGDIKIQESTVDEWKKVLQDFQLCGGNGVTFTGGEITVYNGFEEVIEYAHNLGLGVTVLSNGIMWDSKLIKRIHEYIDEIQISIDGYNAESYYEVRQYNGFYKALDTIKEFSKYKTRVSIAATPLFNNLDKFIAEFEKFALQLMKKYPNVFIKLNLELLDGREIVSTKKENQQYKEKIRNLVEKLYPNYYIETFALNYIDYNIRENCGFGEMSIAPNGDVFWCSRIHELISRVNVKNVEFKNIVELSQKVKTKTGVNNSKTCKECDIKYICGGGCRMEYPNIINADVNKEEWRNSCDSSYKERIYDKMILSNEYFFEV